MTLFGWDSSDPFWSKVAIADETACWPWTAGRTAAGYGSFRQRQAHHLAHRLAYILTSGPIEAGLTIDHVCHTRDADCPGGDDCPHRRCVNPAHLEPVSLAENIRRSGLHGAGLRNSTKTICVRGHALTPDNLMSTPDRRTCKACAKIRRDAHRTKEVVRT